VRHSSTTDLRERGAEYAASCPPAQSAAQAAPERVEELGAIRRPWLREWKSVLFIAVLALSGAGASTGNTQAEPDDFAEFAAALAAADDVAASSVGESILAALRREYSNDSGLRAYESRLKAAEFLAGQMQQQLAKAAGAQLSLVVGEVPGPRNKPSNAALMAVAPAKRFYETSVKVFSSPVHISGLKEEQKSFLARYYDLRLRALVAAVARAGQALAIAEPRFKGTYDYVLVLPLLHAQDRQPLNVGVLPRWMRGPEQLLALSDSCLLHFELPFQAMAIARESSEIQGQVFSESDFYRSSARRCGSTRPKVAVDCLRSALALVPDEPSDLAIDLRFDMVQLWLSSGNYLLAAGEAREIFTKYPRHSSAARAIWLHYYALSRHGNTEEILANIDAALTDDRCRPYEPRLLYIKWWALRRQRNQSARVAALEYDLLKRYGGDPMVAPILLSRGTDLLASQSYNEARTVLQRLVQEFPSTQAAVQARRMLERLKTTETK
jgi:tetratricopeptide (TPR) repeat protein